MSRIWDALQKVEQGIRQNPQQANAYDPCAGISDGFLLTPDTVPPTHAGDVCSDDVSVGLIGAAEVRVQHFGRIIYYTDPESSGADRFRLLRMRLRHLWTAGKLRTLLITSPLPEDGKTTTALNLATALAEQSAKRVLLVDADLHRGSVCDQLGLSPEVGLAECLSEGLNPHAVVRRLEPLGWYLLSAGKRRVPNPTELLRPGDISAILRQLTPHYDWILVDSPPVLALTDAIAVSQVVDGSLLVARAGATPTKAVEDAISLLGRKTIVGLVLNRIEKTNHPYLKYRNYYRASNFSATDADGPHES